jgi:hypothetical protein
LIWTAHADRTARVACTRRAVAGQRRPARDGGARRRLAGVSPAFARNHARELRLHRGWAQNEEGEKTNSLRGLGRWLWRPRRLAPRGGGVADGGARRQGATTRDAGKQGREWGSHLAAKSWGPKRLAEGRRRGRPRRRRRDPGGGRGAVRSDEEEDAPGCRVLVLAARVAMRGGLEEVVATRRSAGWPAMARRPASRRRRVCEDGEVRGSYGCRKGSAQGSSMPL